MGSAGIGSTGHLAGELFKMMAGVNLIHVPYRGNAPALTDLKCSRDRGGKLGSRICNSGCGTADLRGDRLAHVRGTD
jgi:Tripartite tricarboxylate transporter family receptor